MKSLKNIKKSLIIVAIVILLFLVLFLIVTSIWIGNDVKDRCREAQKEYGGSCVEALGVLLEDESQSFGNRNSAIWALGQLGDEKALPILGKYYTGKIPDHESWNEVISQYELKKATDLIKDGKNVTAIFWRYGIN